MAKQYTMFQVEIFEDNVLYIKNAVSCAEELCGFLEKLSPNEAISDWQPWYASNSNDSYLYGHNKHFSKDGLSRMDSSSDDYKTSLYIVNSILMARSMSFDNYFKLNNIDSEELDISKSSVIRKWNPGAGMGPHKDEGGDNPVYSMLIYLNDSYSGGEIEFPDQNLKIKPEAGSVIIFPSKTLHLVHPIADNFRYTVAVLAYNKDMNN